MAGNLPVPNGTEIKVVWALNGQDAALNILHCTHPVGFLMTQTVADSVATIIKTALTSSGLGGTLWTGVTLARVESRNMDSNSDPWFIGAGAPVAGTSAANPLPAATSFVVTLKTGLRGRSFNGRLYTWGFTEDANDAAGGIAAAASTAAVGFWTTVAGNLSTTHTLGLAILSRWTTPPTAPPGTPPTERNPPIMNGVTSIVARDLRWDVQRRRAVPGI